MGFFFNKRFFTSKTECDKYIRNKKNDIITELQYPNKICPTDKWFEFLMEIVNVHKDKEIKIGIGINYFYFVKDKYNCDQLRISRIDDSTIDISYMYSKITEKREEIINKRCLNDSLRNSINEQIFDYKKKQELPLKCKNCGDVNNCEIDHIFPFHQIRTNFFKTINKNEIPNVFIENNCNRIFRDSDIEFENKWKKYHLEHASYQVLCKNCNRKKSGKVNVSV